MSTTNGEPSRVRAALVLPTVFAELLDDLRVLFIGDAAAEDHERLAERCRTLRVLDTGEGCGRRRARGYRSSPYRPGPLGFQPGGFDAVVVPEIAELGEDARERIVDLARIVDGGPLLVGTSPESGVGYETLYGWLEDSFEHVRMFGEEPFAGVAVADFEAGDEPDVVVDASLVAGGGAPRTFFAVASDSLLRLASYTVVRLPPPDETHAERAPRAERGEAARKLEELEADITRLGDALAERSAELEDAHRESRDLEKRLAAAERAAARVAATPDAEVTREHADLEARLVERAKAIRELEAEVERRGQLVRDAVEEARELRKRIPSDSNAVERAVAAEVARAEAQFQVDELRARVRELEETIERTERADPPSDPDDPPGLAAIAPALAPEPPPSRAPAADLSAVERLEGRIAGIRFRLQNAERALSAKSVAARRGEIALDTVDHLRAEIAAQKAENGALTIEVVDLRAETRDLRARAGDATSALAARDALVTRLQLELSEVEQQLRNAELRSARLTDETASLRAAVVDAATESDARQRAVQEAELLRAQLTELRDRARRLEADRFELEERAERAEAAKRTLEERLATEERATAELEQKAKRLESEHAALADEVLGLATELAQIDEQRRASASATPTAERDERSSHVEAELELLRSHAEALEKERDDARALLAETRETLEALRSAPGAAEVPGAGGADVERERKDRDVLLRSLTAQLEERNDRIRALERRLGGSIPAGPPDDEALKRQLLELQERAARLGDEVSAEREARRLAEARLETLERQPDVSIELGRLHEELGRSRQDLDLERGRAEGFERDVRSLREVFVEARQGLEALLGNATTAGDQHAADRIGELLTILGRY